MHYKLIEKESKSQLVISEKEYPSIRQIAQDLKVTYCSVYKNVQYNFNPEEVKKGKKLSQVLFDNKYTVLLINF